MSVMLSSLPAVFAFSIGDPARSLIEWFQPLVDDYGMAIVLSMLAVRLFLLPMTVAQRRNTLLMRTLRPELDAIRQEYAGDQQQMRQVQQERLRTAGFNPFVGCLSLIIIGVIFYAFHTAISQIVGLDAEPPFWGRTWIDALRKPDQLFDFNFRLPLLGKSFHLLPFVTPLYLLIRMALVPSNRREVSQSGFLGALAFGVFLYHLPSVDWLLLLTFLSVGEVENLLVPSPPVPAQDQHQDDSGLLPK